MFCLFPLRKKNNKHLNVCLRSLSTLIILWSLTSEGIPDCSRLLVKIVTKYSGLLPDPPSQSVAQSSGNLSWTRHTGRLVHGQVGIQICVLAMRMWSEDQHQPCYKSIPDLLSLRGEQVKDIPSGPSAKIRTPFHVPSRRGVRMVLSAQVCGLISSHSAGIQDSVLAPLLL